MPGIRVIERIVQFSPRGRELAWASPPHRIVVPMVRRGLPAPVLVAKQGRKVMDGNPVGLPLLLGDDARVSILVNPEVVFPDDRVGVGYAVCNIGIRVIEPFPRRYVGPLRDRVSRKPRIKQVLAQQI